MGIINRFFTVIILGFCFSGILIYGVLIGIPEFIGVDSDVQVISLEAGLLIHNMSSFLKSFNLTVYVISYLGMVLVFWPKKRWNRGSSLSSVAGLSSAISNPPSVVFLYFRLVFAGLVCHWRSFYRLYDQCSYLSSLLYPQIPRGV